MFQLGVGHCTGTMTVIKNIIGNISVVLTEVHSSYVFCLFKESESPSSFKLLV